MSVGLLALLDDVAALARVAAASLDDVVAQAGKAGTKALGIVIDDAAVTPRYVVGFAAARELPIVWRIAVGSLKNKLLFLLPGALLLSYLVPWVITPLLMLGGLYLCYEGAEKILHALVPAPAQAEDTVATGPQDAQAQEDQRVRGAIQTDFILSAEVMALTLASLTTESTMTQAAILAVVGIGVTLLVYGVVALIVKADDAGVALAANDRPVSTLLGLRAATPGAASGPDRALRPGRRHAVLPQRSGHPGHRRDAVGRRRQPPARPRAFRRHRPGPPRPRCGQMDGRRGSEPGGGRRMAHHRDPVGPRRPRGRRPDDPRGAVRPGPGHPAGPGPVRLGQGAGGTGRTLTGPAPSQGGAARPASAMARSKRARVAASTRDRPRARAMSRTRSASGVQAGSVSASPTSSGIGVSA